MYVSRRNYLILQTGKCGPFDVFDDGFFLTADKMEKNKNLEVDLFNRGYLCFTFQIFGNGGNGTHHRRKTSHALHSSRINGMM